MINKDTGVAHVLTYFHGNIYSYLTDDLQVLRLITIAFSTWSWRLNKVT